MATWSIEHIPASGGDPTIASLATWGFAGVQIQFENWGNDMAAITTRGGTIAFDAAQFEYKDKIVIWRDSVRFFHGWITGLGLTAQAQESRTYTLSGPSWWLEHLPFTWPTWPAKEDLSLGERASFRWIGFALDAAIAKGAPIAKDSGNYAPFILPTPDLRASSTCLEVIQRVARLHPMSAGFWDYSGETPIFRASLRAGLTPTTIALGTDAVETLGFTPLPDQQVESVHIGYNYTDDFGAHTVHNTAGDTPYGYGPNKLHIGVDVETAALASEAQSAGIAPLLYASLSPLAWSGAVNLHETGASLPAIMPGNALSVTGGRAEWETMATVVQTVVWSVSDAANDLCTITIGPPERLGPQDYLEFARAGTLAASSAANNPSPYDPPVPPPTLDPGTPGTYDDLNGGTGGSAPLGSIPVESYGVQYRISGCPPLNGVETYRRWRLQTASGTLQYWYWIGNEVCAYDPTGHRVWALSGTCRWIASDDVTVNNALQYVDESAVAHAISAYGVASLPGDPHSANTGTKTVTPTTSEYVGNGVCYTGHNTPADSSRATGSEAYTLSGEDDDGTAYLRALTEQSPSWSRATDATAIQTTRVDTLVGKRRKLRYRTEHTETEGQQIWVEGQWADGVWAPGHYKTAASSATYPTLCGLIPWQRYRVRVTLESRPVDSAGAATGAYAAGGSISHYFVANLDGEGGIDWQTIEPTAGYETRIASTTVEAA